MEIDTIRWSGHRFKCDPKVAAEALIAIDATYGTIESELIVNVARDPAHPLHADFEWNDTVAGEKYRYAQAGHMLRCIRFQMVRPESSAVTPPEFYRMFYKNTDESGRATKGWRPLAQVLANPESRRRLLQAALLELRDFQRKYQHLSELAALFETVDAVNRSLKGGL